MNLIKILGAVLFAFLFVFGLVKLNPTTPVSIGSVPVANEYQSTTTDATFLNTAKLLDTGSGSLANINITTVGTGTLTLYDATTTDITQRASNLSTSTIILAKYQVTTGTGSWQIDSVYRNGLMAEFIGTVVASSTVTFRP